MYLEYKEKAWKPGLFFELFLGSGLVSAMLAPVALYAENERAATGAAITGLVLGAGSLPFLPAYISSDAKSTISLLDTYESAKEVIRSANQKYLQNRCTGDRDK